MPLLIATHNRPPSHLTHISIVIPRPAGGAPRPYTWAIVAGQLPPGLGLSGHRIQGTPSTAGTFALTARVRDSGGQEATREFSITVT